MFFVFFFSSRRRHTRFKCDWSSDVCSSDLIIFVLPYQVIGIEAAAVGLEQRANLRSLRRADRIASRISMAVGVGPARQQRGAQLARPAPGLPQADEQRLECARTGHLELHRPTAPLHL